MKIPLLAKGLLAVVATGAATAGALSLAARPAGAPPSTNVAAALPVAGNVTRTGGVNAFAAGTTRQRGFSTPEVVFQANWGAAPNELGVLRPEQGARYCPSAVAVDGAGTIHILDQINQRVVSLAPGRPPMLHPVDRMGYTDLVLAPDGTMVLSDNLRDRMVTFYDPAQNRTVDEIDLDRPDVPEPGLVSAVFANPAGVFVELEHQDLVRIADAAHRPTTGGAPGRINHDGSATLRLSADGATATVELTPADGSPALTADVTFPKDILYVRDLTTDARNRVFVTAVLADEDLATGDFDEQISMVVALTEDLREIARVKLPETDTIDDQVRPVAVADDGTVYHLACGPTAATLWRTSL